MQLGQVCNTSFQSFIKRGIQKHIPQLKRQSPPAKRHWKLLMLFRVLVRISVLPLGQVVQIGLGPTIWAISSEFIKQNFQTSWSWIGCRFGNTTDYHESKSQTNLKWLSGNDFTSFLWLGCVFWYFCKIKRVFLRNEIVCYIELTIDIEKLEIECFPNSFFEHEAR